MAVEKPHLILQNQVLAGGVAFRRTKKNVKDHDHEIEEARWVNFDEALEMLAFKSERDVVAKAQELIWVRKK